MSDEIKSLRQIIEKTKSNQHYTEIEQRINEISETMEKIGDGYSDLLTRHLIHTIEVINENTLLIKYRCEYEKEQQINLQIRKLGKTA